MFTDHTGLREELADYVEYESRQRPGWAVFMSENIQEYVGDEVPPVMDALEPRAPDGVLQAIQDLKNGGISFKIPVERRLTEPGSVGDAPLQGTGESIKYDYRHIYVNAHQKAFRIPTGKEAQMMTDAMLSSAKQAAPKLKNWYGEMQDGNINFSILYGVDSNLTTMMNAYLPGADYQFSTPFSPGNFYVAGSTATQTGKVPYDWGRPRTEGFESRLKSLLNEMMTKEVSAVGLTANRLRGFLAASRRDGIRLLKTPLGMKRVVVMSDATLVTLKNDQEFKEWHKWTVPETLQKNPYFSDVAVIWENCVIFVFNQVWGVLTDENNQVVTRSGSGNSLGCPHYGPKGFWIAKNGAVNDDNLDRNQCSLVYTFCAGMLYKAFGRRRFEIDMDTKDFKKRVEYGLFAYVSFMRGDNFDDDGNTYDPMTWRYNDSLAVLAVKSPQSFGV